MAGHSQQRSNNLLLICLLKMFQTITMCKHSKIHSYVMLCIASPKLESFIDSLLRFLVRFLPFPTRHHLFFRANFQAYKRRVFNTQNNVLGVFNHSLQPSHLSRFSEPIALVGGGRSRSTQSQGCWRRGGE